MIRPILAALALSLVSCSTGDVRRQEALMNGIESAIRLPPGAGPLENYARYYTEDEGKVIGAFTTEIEAPRPADYGCEELQSNFESKPVACPAIADVPIGQRRWVKFEDYPNVSGDGCTAIDLVYDPQTRKITYLECDRPRH